MTLAERRWDMYHILSTTSVALCLRLFVGIPSRLYYSFSFVDPPLAPIQPTLGTWVKWAEPVALIFIIIFAGILVILLYEQRKWILTISASLHESRIISSKVKPCEVKKIFPQSLFCGKNRRYSGISEYGQATPKS